MPHSWPVSARSCRHSSRSPVSRRRCCCSGTSREPEHGDRGLRRLPSSALCRARSRLRQSIGSTPRSTGSARPQTNAALRSRSASQAARSDACELALTDRRSRVRAAAARRLAAGTMGRRRSRAHPDPRCASHHGDDQAFAARVDRLCTTAEVTEYIAYLKGFAIFPAPKLLYGRAREGVRSAITPVFAAIACHNPYPFDHFDEDAWNQMVVKCVFNGAPIETIVGLQERRNPRGRADAARPGGGAARRRAPAAGRRSRLCRSQLTVRGTTAHGEYKKTKATHVVRDAERAGVADRIGDGTGSGWRCTARRADVSALLHGMSRCGWTRRRQELHAARGSADAERDTPNSSRTAIWRPSLRKAARPSARAPTCRPLRRRCRARTSPT